MHIVHIRTLSLLVDQHTSNLCVQLAITIYTSFSILQFSDMLLHTYPAVNGMYKFKDRMQLCEMQVQDSAVSADPYSFEVHCTSRSLLLIAT